MATGSTGTLDACVAALAEAAPAEGSVALASVPPATLGAAAAPAFAFFPGSAHTFSGALSTKLAASHIPTPERKFALRILPICLLLKFIDSRRERSKTSNLTRRLSHAGTACAAILKEPARSK
jgi:hypothetical protein